MIMHLNTVNRLQVPNLFYKFPQCVVICVIIQPHDYKSGRFTTHKCRRCYTLKCLRMIWTERIESFWKSEICEIANNCNTSWLAWLPHIGPAKMTNDNTFSYMTPPASNKCPFPIKSPNVFYTLKGHDKNALMKNWSIMWESKKYALKMIYSGLILKKSWRRTLPPIIPVLNACAPPWILSSCAPVCKYIFCHLNIYEKRIFPLICSHKIFLQSM